MDDHHVFCLYGWKIHKRNNYRRIFCAGGDSKFGLICDTITMWCITVPIGFFVAFVLKLPILVVYLIINIDEVIKLPAVYNHYKKYLWVKDLTAKTEERNV